MDTSVFPLTRSNFATNDWEGSAEQESELEDGERGGTRSRLGVSAPVTSRRGGILLRVVRREKEGARWRGGRGV